MNDDSPYVGREQTLVKHRVLRTYLSRFAPIVFNRWNSITYIDCFSGPWNAHTHDLTDTSFAIAVDELRKARAIQETKGKRVQLRCLFLERDKNAFTRLKSFSDQATDVEIATRNATLEESIPFVLEFARAGGQDTFPFIFIDPTGWTGFEMETIAPLLKLSPCEVLVNLMTKDVRRFIGWPEEQTQESFERLFGRRGVRERVVGTQGLERDDVVIEEYREAWQKRADSSLCAPPSCFIRSMTGRTST